MPRRSKRSQKTPPQAESYSHPEAKTPLRPDVGVQAQFKKKKPPKTYRYDSSLSPALDWDGQNAAREQGETLLAEIAAQTARAQDREERQGAASGDRGPRSRNATVEGAEPAVPELGGQGRAAVLRRAHAAAVRPRAPFHQGDHRNAARATSATSSSTLFDLFGDPQHSITDQVLRAYEYQDKWVNRMILGDSLVVMNSLLHYESLGGQVQMIYMDPPYGVKFGSNFQPFVRKRDVKPQRR